MSGRSIAHFGSFAYPSAKKLPNLSVQFFPFRGVTPSCLSLLSNAVLVWNTVRMSEIVRACVRPGRRSRMRT